MFMPWAPMMDSSGIVGRDELAQRARDIRTQGRRVVFTNGCFDIIHLGHVIYLRQARSLGDELFVGVNSDDSTRKLKGPGRPYNPESARAGVVAALAAVSGVTIFDEDTASNLVEQIHPDVYVKGGDYSSDPGSPAFPIEGEVVSGYGGEVRIVPFAAGYSTTRLIETIRDGR
jgi:rfaE bifunctional protein nucleotidyltransferase chain/domain